MLDLLTKHFAVISTAIVAAAFSLSIVFVFSYLSVFDWSLIWIVEYPDLTKFMILGVALISSFATIVLSYAQTFYNWAVLRTPSGKFVGILAVILRVVSLILEVYFDYRRDNHLQEYHITRSIALASVAGFIVISLRGRTFWMERTWWQISNYVATALFVLGICGRAAGLQVRDVSLYRHEILTEDSKFADANVVMILSHHTILYVGNKVVTLPTAQIIRVIGQETQ